MIDKSNEIFTLLAKGLRDKYSNITVLGENVDVPSKFPCVTFDETLNIPTHLDTSVINKFARVQYRVQVFSNKESGKRAEAREIYKTVDEILQSVGLLCTSFITTPTIYNSSIYQITAIHSGTLDKDGYVYRR